MAQFSGLPETRWETGDRIMTLLKPFSYTDKNGKEWKVKKDAWLNGATIPRTLWTIVGSPYVGKYRRASIVHDFYVGEGKNDNVTYRERRKADKMFYRACRTDGVKQKYATALYIAVSLGSWASQKKLKNFNVATSEIEIELLSQKEAVTDDEAILNKYNKLIREIQQKELLEIETMNEDDIIDGLERIVDKEISLN